MRPEQFYSEPIEPIAPADILAHWESKPITWSQFSAWKASKPTWYARYVLNEKSHASETQRRKMDFGNEVGDMIESDPTFCPTIPRLPVFELELSTTFSGVPIAGHLDNAEPPHRINEFKTGGRKYPWTQAKVDRHRQLDVYVALMWLVHKQKPENIDLTLFWLPTEDYMRTEVIDGEVFTTQDVRLIDTPPLAFQTKRNLSDALNILKDLTLARKEMREYIVHQLSTGEACKQSPAVVE